MLENIIKQLEIDLDKTKNDCINLISNKMQELKRDGIVVALSGGLDSAVVATLVSEAIDKEKIHLLNMPERDSKSIHQRHAKNLSLHLGIKLKKKSLTWSLWAIGAYNLLPIGFIPFKRFRAKLVEYGQRKLLRDNEKQYLITRQHPRPNSLIAKGNAYALSKHRMRMIKIYQYAEINNLMVVGAANFTELLTGTFSKWGVDHCADLMPIMHLYRSQVQKLAKYLGVPEYIRNKKADPDIIPGIPDKGELLGSFDKADQILYGIVNQMDKEKLIELFSKNQVDYMLKLNENSRHMRESPYSL